MSTSEVLIVGAGPFGLSIAAHMRRSGLDHRIVGRPMDTYRTRVPVGMVMKSEPYASDIASLTPGYGVQDYCRAERTALCQPGRPARRGAFSRLRRLVHRATRARCSGCDRDRYPSGLTADSRSPSPRGNQSPHGKW